MAATEFNGVADCDKTSMCWVNRSADDAKVFACCWCV